MGRNMQKFHPPMVFSRTFCPATTFGMTFQFRGLILSRYKSKRKEPLSVQSKLKRMDSAFDKRRKNVTKFPFYSNISPLFEADNLPKSAKKILDSDVYKTDKFWGDEFDNDYDFFEKQQQTIDGEDRYVPQQIETLQRRNKDFRNFPSLKLMRLIHSLHKTKPKIWTENVLSTHFGISQQQIKRYIQNVQVEKNIQRLFIEESTQLRQISPNDKEALRKFEQERLLPARGKAKKKTVRKNYIKQVYNTRDDYENEGKDNDIDENEFEDSNFDDTQDKSGYLGDEREGRQVEEVDQKAEEYKVEENEDEKYKDEEDEGKNEENNTEEKFDEEKKFAKNNKKDTIKDYLNDDLHNYVMKSFKIPDAYEPTMTLLMEVFNKRTGKFGYQQRMKMFGSTDDETLKHDLGSIVPKLAPRKVPKNGPASGRPICAKPTRKLKTPLIITDITHMRKHKLTDMNIPTMVRDTNGVLRNATINEYIKIRRKEVTDKRRKKFSPH